MLDLIIITVLFAGCVLAPIAVVINREILIPIIDHYNKDLAFSMRLNIAEKTSYYNYDGSVCFAEIYGIPLGRVAYSDGKVSANMSLGSAVNYRDIFGGEVIRPE